MAKDFSNPKKLGFMRLIQVLFAFNVVLTISLLGFVVSSNAEIGFDSIIDFLNLIFDAISFWLIWKRKRAARYWVIGFSVFNITIGSVFHLVNGTFSPTAQIIESSFDIILLLYFATSRRAKAILVEPFSNDTRTKMLLEETRLYQPKTWRFWRNLIIYFCVFSVVGHWMEAGYCLFIKWGILPGIYDPNSGIWRDWLFPFCVYGVGAVACVLLFYPVKMYLQRRISNPVAPLFLSFVINGCVCCLIELCMGLMLNQPLPDGTMPLWDYRDMFCNFMGQICLQNGIAFGLVATLMTWVLYPLMERGLARLPKEAGNGLFVGIVTGFLILFFLYCINWELPNLDEASGDVSEVAAMEYAESESA